MKKLLSIIPIFILLICCTKKNEQKSLNGNYYVFSNDSIYSELFITDKEMAFYNDISDIQFWDYFINYDTLITKTEIPDLNPKYLIDNSFEDIIILNNIANNEKSYLKTIKDSEYILEKAFYSDFNYLKYKTAYLNRRNIILGVSKRFNYDSLVKSESSDSVPKTVKLSY